MKKLFLLATAVLAFGIGYVHADTYADVYTNPASGSSLAGNANGKGAFSVITPSGDVSFGNSSLQIGSNGGSGTFTIASIDGSYITSIAFTSQSSYPINELTSEDGNIVKNGDVYTFTPTSATLTSASFSMSAQSNKKVRVAPITVNLTSDHSYLTMNFGVSSGTVSCTKSTGASDLVVTTTGSASSNRLSVGSGKTLTFTSSNHNIASIHFTFVSHSDGASITATTGTFSKTTWTPTEDVQSVRFNSGASNTIGAISVKLVEKVTYYTVTYDANGHGTAPDAEEGLVSGAKATEPTAPTATGYTFGGWYKEKACTNEWDFAEDEVTENITLYAKWAINSHTLAWNFGEGGTTTSDNYTEAGSVDYGTTIVYPADNTMSREGFDFIGWAPDVTSMPDENLTIAAVWAAAATKYNITFAKGDYAAYAAEFPANVNASNVTLAALATDNNFRFDGWKADVAVKNNTIDGETITVGTLIEADTKVFVTAATMFTAQWTPKYAVTFNSDGGSAVATQYIISGENASEPADPTKDGYVFQGWQLAGADYDFATAVTAAITLDANWKQLFTVSYYDGETKLGEEDVVDGESPAHSGDYETKAEHYTFDAWKNKAADIINVATLVVTKDTALYGYWTEDPKAVVTFRVDEAQYGEIQNVYLGGKVAPVDAPSKAGYVFNGWYNGESKFDFTATIAAAGTITLDAKWEEGDANHYIYAYNDATRYDGAVYHTPEGKIAASGDDKNLTTPYTLFSGTAGITSIVATSARYDGKGSHMNAYLKIATGGTSKLQFTIASGYTAVLKIKMGSYDVAKSAPTVTMTAPNESTINYTGTMSGKAETEDNYAELIYNLSAAGTYTLTTASKNLYISHIDLETVSIPTSLDNTEVEVKAVKRIENGMLIIEKAGKTYNVMGQAIR